MGPHFLKTTPFLYWFHLERYLKALKLRMERAGLNPQKEAQRVKLIEPWQQIHDQYLGDPHLSPQKLRAHTAFRWLLEEYSIDFRSRIRHNRISFYQEITSGSGFIFKIEVLRLF